MKKFWEHFKRNLVAVVTLTAIVVLATMPEIVFPNVIWLGVMLYFPFAFLAFITARDVVLHGFEYKYEHLFVDFREMVVKIGKND